MKETLGPAGVGSLGAGGGSSVGLGSEDGAVGSSEGSGFDGAGAGVASDVGSVVGSAVGSGGGAEGSADALLSGGGVGSVANAANGAMSVDMKTTSVKMIRTRLVVDWRSGVGTKSSDPLSRDESSRRAAPAGSQP
jgi:hypothetical protein